MKREVKGNQKEKRDESVEGVCLVVAEGKREKPRYGEKWGKKKRGKEKKNQ